MRPRQVMAALGAAVGQVALETVRIRRFERWMGLPRVGDRVKKLLIRAHLPAFGSIQRGFYGEVARDNPRHGAIDAGRIGRGRKVVIQEVSLGKELAGVGGVARGGVGKSAVS